MNFEKIKKVKNSQAFTVVDIVLFAVFAIAIGLSFWLIYRKPAVTVLINDNGVEHEYALDVNTTVALEHLTVHIEDGKVWVTDADCPDKTCEKTGVISRAGQSIVCLPHGIVVTVSGESNMWGIGL